MARGIVLCLPNVITVFRMLLTVPLGYYLLMQHYESAMLVMLIAAVSDGLDGFLARAWNCQSRFGAICDPLADKLLLNTAFICLCINRLIPQALMWLTIFRDVMIVLGGTLYQYTIEPVEISPTILSKFNTCMQIILIVAVLLQATLHGVGAQKMNGLFVLVALTTSLSMADYLRRWGGKFLQKIHRAR